MFPIHVDILTVFVRVFKTQKLPNGLGIYDMAGNVDEWVYDWWGDIESDTPITGPELGSYEYKLTLGGNYGNYPSFQYKVTGKDGPKIDNKETYRGFRVARNAM